MKDLNSEKKIGDLYREFIEGETNRVEIRREKERFLKTYFRAEHFLPLEPAMSLSGLALITLFVFLFHLQGAIPGLKTPAKQMKSLEAVQETREPAVPNLSLSEAGKPELEHPRVEVKRVSSKSGIVMIYQRVYIDTPFTVVWVFTS